MLQFVRWARIVPLGPLFLNKEAQGTSAGRTNTARKAHRRPGDGLEGRGKGLKLR